MQKLEGTILRIVSTKDSAAKGTTHMIAQIMTANGEKHVIKGNTTRHGHMGDYVIGNFHQEVNVRHGEQLNSKGVIELYLPRTIAAIKDRCSELAKKHQFKLTPTMRSLIEHIAGDNPEYFWKDVLTYPVALDGLNLPRWKQLCAGIAEIKREGNAVGTASSLDVELYLKGLGLSWSERTIRILCGYEEDCENPEKEKITLQHLKEDPLAILEVDGIKAVQIEEYLRALERLAIIDDVTVQVGGLIKKCRVSERDSNTCVRICADRQIAELRTNAVFIKYLMEYNECLYRKSVFHDEQTIAEFVVNAVTAEPHEALDVSIESLKSMPPDAGKAPTNLQCAAVANIFNCPISTLEGSAGSGKTTALRLLARYIKTHAPDLRSNVLFLAPTGKAVNRIKESIGDIELTDSDNILTIHRCAGLMRKYHSPREGAEEPEVDECIESPLMVVLDEGSMICQQTLAMLLRELRRYPVPPHIVIMGDPSQLTPVGLGAPFIDILATGIVPCTKLDVVHRQGPGSALLEAITQIRMCQDTTVRDDSFRILRISDTNGLREIRKWLDQHAGIAGKAIIVPTGAMVDELTPIIRDHVNPEKESTQLYVGEELLPYRMGDRIMQVKNNYVRDVFNGSVGVVVGVQFFMEEGEHVPKLHVRFDGRDNDFYYRLSEADKELVLAYVMTTHKAQGSEYDAVLIVMDRAIHGFLNRNLIYTGASRGKGSVTIMIKELGIMRLWKDIPVKPLTNLGAQILSQVCVTDC